MTAVHGGRADERNARTEKGVSSREKKDGIPRAEKIQGAPDVSYQVGGKNRIRSVLEKPATTLVRGSKEKEKD